MKWIQNSHGHVHIEESLGKVQSATDLVSALQAYSLFVPEAPAAAAAQPSDGRLSLRHLAIHRKKRLPTFS